MPSAGLEPATSPTKRLKTNALDRIATGIGAAWIYGNQIKEISQVFWEVRVEWLVEV
jgi:hypothetical protein